MNVIRRSPIANLATLAVIVAATAARAHFAPLPAEAFADTPTFLGALLGGWQTMYPVATLCAACAVWFAAGWTIGLVVKVRELYFIRTTITIPIYGFAACGLLFAHDYLAASAASLLFAVAMRSYIDSYRDGYGFSPIFFGSLCLGLLPLIYAPAVALLALMPLAVIIFKRSAREAIVAVAGMLLAPLAVSYICWGAGGDFATPVMQSIEALTAVSGYRFFGAVTAGEAVLACTLLALVLGAAFISSANVYSMNTRARFITLYNLCAFAVALATLAMPSSTATAFGLIAVPTAMAVPVMLVQIREQAAAAIYGGLALLFVLHLVIA